MATYAKIINGLTDLGIHKMQEHLDTYIELVNKGEKSFSEALEELIEIEQRNNQIRAENACVKTAGFPFLKTMEDFEFEFQPGVNKKELLELNKMGFLDKKENILFVGSSGVGKTHLATAIGIEAASQRISTYFINFSSLMLKMKKAISEKREGEIIKHFLKYTLLIIDEIGYLPVDKETTYLFFQLIAARYENKSTILTTNQPFARWGEVFGDSVVASAILDRLVHHCEIIKINGNSYRIKDKKIFDGEDY